MKHSHSFPKRSLLRSCSPTFLMCLGLVEGHPATGFSWWCHFLCWAQAINFQSKPFDITHGTAGLFVCPTGALPLNHNCEVEGGMVLGVQRVNLSATCGSWHLFADLVHRLKSAPRVNQADEEPKRGGNLLAIPVPFVSARSSQGKVQNFTSSIRRLSAGLGTHGTPVLHLIPNP